MGCLGAFSPYMGGERCDKIFLEQNVGSKSRWGTAGKNSRMFNGHFVCSWVPLIMFQGKGAPTHPFLWLC